MAKKGLKINIKINLTNRWLYTLIVIGILAIIGVSVWAFTSPTGVGHDLSEIQTCDSEEILQMSGGSWSCVNMPSGAVDTRCDVSGICSRVCIGADCKTSWPGGITTETDPTVKSWAKTDNPNIPGDIKIMRNYLYNWDQGLFGSGWPNPRCSCDTNQNNRGDCFEDYNYKKYFYTNIDSGSVCYDWFTSTGGEAYHDGLRKSSSPGPFVVNTFGYKYP